MYPSKLDWAGWQKRFAIMPRAGLFSTYGLSAPGPLSSRFGFLLPLIEDQSGDGGVLGEFGNLKTLI
jgi:hypothetical protein